MKTNVLSEKEEKKNNPLFPLIASSIAFVANLVLVILSFFPRVVQFIYDHRGVELGKVTNLTFSVTSLLFLAMMIFSWRHFLLYRREKKSKG